MIQKDKSFRFTTGKQYFASTVILFFFIVILYFLQNVIGYETVSLILLMIIFLLPIFNFETGPIILAAVISALAWDYYFIPPHFTLHIDSTEDGVMLMMFFVVSLTNGILTAQLKMQKKNMYDKDRKLNAILNLVKDLSAAVNYDDVVKRIVDQISNSFGFNSAIFLQLNEEVLNRVSHPASNFRIDELEWLAAQVAFKDKTYTGKSTDLLNNSEGYYLPIIKKENVLGVIGIKIDNETKSNNEEIEFIKEYVKEISNFLEKHSVYSNP